MTFSFSLGIFDTILFVTTLQYKVYNIMLLLSTVEGGKKWAVLIIRDLLSGKKRFGRLLASLVGISPRTLSARLNDLEKNGVLKKRVFPEIPLRVEYSLTKR